MEKHRDIADALYDETSHGSNMAVAGCFLRITKGWAPTAMDLWCVGGVMREATSATAKRMAAAHPPPEIQAK